MHRSIAVLLTFVAALAATKAEAAPERFVGSFAIAGKTTAVSATLTVERTGPLAATVDLVEQSGGVAIRAYDVDMTKRLHMIVISDDFTVFEHLHPALDGQGHFTLAFRVPSAGRYYIYTDAEPHGLGKTVFRFAVPFGRAPDRAPSLASTASSSTSGPYAVTLDSLVLHAGAPTSLHVRVTKRGQPAGDLTPYLGAAAHAVFIDASTLAYVHVHPSAGTSGAMAAMPGMKPMDGMPGMGETADLPIGSNVPASMQLHVSAVPAGRYKLWLQFMGGGALHVASFVLDAR